MLKDKHTLKEIPVGNVREIRSGSIIRDMMTQARTYGPIFQLHIPGAKRKIVLSSFALIDEVCNDEFFDKGIGQGVTAARALAGDGLFTADTSNPKWRKAHAIMMPSFSLQAMKNYLPGMQEIAGQLVERWGRLNPEDEINIPNDRKWLLVYAIALGTAGSLAATNQTPDNPS